MKNISKTIASIGLSLLSIGVMAQASVAQSQNHPNYFKKLAHKAVAYPKKTSVAPTHSPSTNMTSFQMAYWVDDANLIGSDSYSISGIQQGSPTFFQDQLNERFVQADTNTQYPTILANPNYALITNAIVAFDTIMDQSGNSYFATPGSMSVDTVTLGGFGYANHSGTNDTLVIYIDSVNAKGYPEPGKIYATDTITLYHNVTIATTGETISGDDLDTVFYSLPIVTAFTLPRNHTTFCVNVTFLGNKSDTFELGYGFPYAQCNGGYYYANTFTQVGKVFTSAAPKAINVNSYNIGWQVDYGNNTLLPETDGTVFDTHNDPHNYSLFGNVCGGGGSGDTLFFYEQDYAIYASVTFDNTTGINNIAAGGLSVNQNYPNPFNKETQITYSLTQASNVTFTVYDVTGRAIMTNNYNTVTPGQHEINLSANSFSPGIYFYIFNVNGSLVTKKMVITE